MTWRRREKQEEVTENENDGRQTKEEYLKCQIKIGERGQKLEQKMEEGEVYTEYKRMYVEEYKSNKRRRVCEMLTKCGRAGRKQTEEEDKK